MNTRKPATLAHTALDVTLAVLVLGAVLLVVLFSGCSALDDATGRIAGALEQDADANDTAWCDAFDLALEACPLVDAEGDPAAELTQGSVAKGCTDVALEVAGFDVEAEPSGRSALWGAIMNCHGNYDGGDLCGDALAACGVLPAAAP